MMLSIDNTSQNFDPGNAMAKATEECWHITRSIVEAQLAAVVDALGITVEQAATRFRIVLDTAPGETRYRIVRTRAAHGKPAGSQVGKTVRARADATGFVVSCEEGE